VSAIVPVQFEPAVLDGPNKRPVNGVCGTCTKCGRSASAALDPDEGGPVKQRRAAVAAVCEELIAACEERLPLGDPPGIAPAHEDRRIPKGVTLLVETPSGDRLPVAVDAKQKLVTVWAGVVLDAVVLVVPDTEEYAQAAAEFKIALIARGYKWVRTAPPGTVATPRKPAGAVA
jgi:hypothetical protein